jgi:hypothetical protein
MTIFGTVWGLWHTPLILVGLNYIVNAIFLLMNMNRFLQENDFLSIGAFKSCLQYSYYSNHTGRRR